MSRAEDLDCVACLNVELGPDALAGVGDVEHSDECNLDRALTAVSDAGLLPETEAQAAAAMSPSALRDAAVYYATIGWPVFPLRPGMTLPLFPSAHDPGSGCHGECGQVGHGLWDASTDPAVVAAWWAAEPWANVALRTGDRFDVIDLDMKNGEDGIGSFGQLCEETGQRPVVLASVQTGNGGCHLFIKATGRGNFVGLRNGVDYRGVGGYVCAAPSRLAPDGRRYRWITPPSAALTERPAA